MNGVGTATAPMNAAQSQASSSTASPRVQPASLLPDPLAGALAETDPLSLLYLFESKDQTLGVEEGSRKISALQTERHQAIEQEQQAIQRAIDASHHQDFWSSLGSIFGEVAKVAAVVASIAAAVATLGAATPIAALAVAGAVLSTASFADGELHVLRSLGVDEKTAGCLDMGMSVAGAFMSCGAGWAAGGGVASSTLSSVARATAVVSGAGTVASASFGIAAGEARANADEASADEIAAQARSSQAQRRMQMVIADTESSDEESRKAMATIGNTKTIQAETSLSAATMVRG